MKRRVVQTLMVGVMLVGLGAMLHSPAVFAETFPSPRESDERGAVGRYQIVFNPSVRADTFLLDTVTGRIWQRGQFDEFKSKPVMWQIMDRADSVAGIVEWSNLQKRLQEMIAK